MKKVVLLVSCCLIIAVIIVNLAFFHKKDDIHGVTINVYNWGEFISDGYEGGTDVNNEFTRRTGIKVNYMTFQNNESLFAKMQSGGAKYDVIIPSDYMVSKLINKNMLRKLDFSHIPNFSLIRDDFKNPAYDPTNEYSVPYVWGLVGIFYNKIMVDEKEEDIDWEILWKEKYKGKILMFDNPRDAFAIAQFKLGLSVNSQNLNEWNVAADELKKQRPLVQSYVMDQIFDKMSNNEAALAPYYAGDAKSMMDKNPNVGVVIPKSGTCRFVDAMCVPVNSEHPVEAQKYINFMCEKEIAAANANKTGYSSPEDAVINELPTDISQNSIFYPKPEVLGKTQVFTSLPDLISENLDELWVMVKIGGPGTPAGLVAMLVFFAASYIGVVVYKKSKYK